MSRRRSGPRKLHLSDAAAPIVIALWHRVRVATRDNSDLIVGDRLCEKAVNRTYQLRLYPPTLVAAKDVPGSNSAPAQLIVAVPSAP